MATSRNGNYNWNTGISPLQLLSNAYQTIGKEKAEELGLHCTGTQRAGRNEVLTFDMRHDKNLERTVGNIMVKVSHAAVNTSEFKDTEGETQVRHYGGLIGTAGVNMDGQGTLQSSFPCIVIPDRKSNYMQRNAVNASFASLIGKLEGVEATEVNPASVNIYESTTLVNGLPTFRIAVIEASGLFGECNDTGFYWSVMQYPLSDFVSKKEEDAPKTSRTRRPRVKTPQTPADDQTGDSADMEALAHAG